MHVSLARGKNSWVSLDSFVDFLISIDMRPAFELGFSPDWMASDPTITGPGSPDAGNHTMSQGYGYRDNQSPPANNTIWAEFISAMATHFVERYGEDTAAEFMFEVWNEPQWAFAGSKLKYLAMYEATARALKAVSPRLRVGGPATSEDMVNVSASVPAFGTDWLSNFTSYCRKSGTPFDYVTNHN
jgi:xylan 1,4-beta-xylosidase